MANMNVETGLVPDLDNDAYHAAPGVSKSHLDDIAIERANSPKHYWHARIRDDREPHSPTKAMIDGTAIHTAILEPEEFGRRYIATPSDAPKRPTDAQLNAAKPSAKTIDAIQYWEDFDRANEGKTILSADDMEMVIGSRDAVLMHPQVGGLFTGGRAEQTFFAIDPETGELVKCRLDYEKLERGLIVDLKSTEDASEEGFGGSATKFRYDVQDPWYRDTTNLACGDSTLVRNFAFVAVEKKKPHAVGLYYLTPEQVALGRKMARRDLRLIAECRAKGHWPDFAETPKRLRIRNAARSHLI